MKSPRHYHAISAFASWILGRKGAIEANLRAIEPSVRTLTILDHYSNNIGNNDYPLLMLEQAGVLRDWEALDTGAGPTYKTEFQTTLWGLVAGYDDSLMDKLASELEASVAEVLNHRHEVFSLEGWQFYFNESMPLTASSYGITKVGKNLARGFTSNIVIHTILSAAQAPEAQ